MVAEDDGKKYNVVFVCSVRISSGLRLVGNSRGNKEEDPMIRTLIFTAFLVAGATGSAAVAQVKNFVPVTQEMLLNPSPNDWLMFSRTYDAQRFSPLKQIDRQNVGELRMAWVRGLAPGTQETIPTVYRGVMYVVSPGGGVHALDATNGDLIWDYRRKLPGDSSPDTARTKSLAIFEDLIFYTAPDGYIVGLDARTGELRWETKVLDYKSGAQHTSAPIVVDGKVLSGRSCFGSRENCFIAAHDARTGKEVWRFYTTPLPGEPGDDSWGGAPVDLRRASTWGLPGSYDPVRKLVYWGIANPTPNTRMQRHGGNPDAISRSAPADLYSNSTVALNPATGKLVWYYQHLPGDDWDSDHTHERVLLRTPFNPDPAAVKWINPRISRGQERDVSVSVGEPGGIWVLDRATGEFLWATPFPYDVPEFHISKVDLETGKTYINWDRVFKKDGERYLVCFFNTRSYWPTAYHPGRNSLYIPYADSCLDMTAGGPRFGIPRPGSDPKAFAGVAKVNLATGRVDWRYTQRFPGNGAMLATAGDLIFWGDLDRRFKALDADTGKILWETILGGVIQVSTITYAVNGRQYVAVLTGNGGSGTEGLLGQIRELKPPRHNAIYVFALPQPR
ncbi:MAG: PQQ-binding-like beta-propeller repeat protein [Acidobacteria bacterium]|nr:PQQ-binding-like beta-propeller repeat protein [Acidobacteriota bacterium]